MPEYLGNKLSDIIQRDPNDTDTYGFNVCDVIKVDGGCYWFIINNAPVPTSWAIIAYTIGIFSIDWGCEEIDEELHVIAKADSNLEWELV